MARRSFDRDDYFHALNLAQDPFQNTYSENTFFITPELQHRLDLIRHLLEFSQQILLVKGVSKVGKTVFCQHLMATADADWVICRVDASEKIGPDTLVKAMLQEHMDDSEDESETIAGLNAYLGFCNLNTKVPILFIDDVDNLNQASLRFIFQLMDFREQDTFIRVVLVGQDSFLQRLNEMAEELSNNNLIHAITIPTFTSEQTSAYLRYRLRACGGREDMFTEKEESRIHKVAAGLAGDINFLARQGLSDPAELHVAKPVVKIASKNNSKLKWISKLTPVVLVITFCIIFLWLYSQNEVGKETKTVLVQLPSEPLSVVSKTTSETTQISPADLPDAWLESQVLPVSTPDSENMLVESSLEEQMRRQIVIEDEIKSPIDSSEKKTPILDPGPDPEAQILPARTSSSEAKIRREDWLLAQSADSYVLQLMGAMELATITRFLQEAQLDRAKMALFKTQQTGKDWYVLVYGLYSGPEQARAAIPTLTQKAQAEKPWPKTMASIHEAMNAP